MLGPVHNNGSPSPASGNATPGAPAQVVSDGSVAGAQSPATAPAAHADAVLGIILKTLGNAIDAERVADVLPNILPQTATAVRDVALLFIERGTLPQDLATIAATVQDGVEAGVLPRSEGEAFINLLGQVTASAKAGLDRVLESLIEATTRTGEARLAAARQNGEAARAETTERATLLDLIARVRVGEGLRTALRQSGRLKAFETACDRVMARLTGVQLQNLHGLEHAYTFIELPCAPDSEIRHGQIHLFRDGRRRSPADQHAEALVAFDLATTRLGNLWIALRVAGGHCECRFKAAEAEARDALSEASQELVEALAGAGYTEPRVHVMDWDGDRLREVASLMRQRAKVDLRA